jgi:hypothetical protein
MLTGSKSNAAASARAGLKPAKTPLYQPEGRDYASGYRLVVLRCQAPRSASGNLMIVFHGCGFSPRRVSVRKHDRPMRHRKKLDGVEDVSSYSVLKLLRATA